MSFNLNVHRGIIIKCTIIICYLILIFIFNILAVFVVIWLLHTIYKVATSTLNKIADFFFTFCSYINAQWLGPHQSLCSQQQCSLTPSPAARLEKFTVSHQLTPHARSALRITLTVPHSLNMHTNQNSFLLPTQLWCFCQVTMFLVRISQLPI